MPARELDEEHVAPSAYSAPVVPAGARCPSLSGRIYKSQYQQLLSTRDRQPDVMAVETRWMSTITHDDGRCVLLNHSFYVRELYGQVYFNHHIKLNNGDVLYKKIALYSHRELIADSAVPLPTPGSPHYTTCHYEARELANCAQTTVPSSASLFLYYNFPGRPLTSRGHPRRQQSLTPLALPPPPVPSVQGQRAQRHQQQRQRSIRRSRRRANSDDFLADAEGATMRVLIHSYLNQTDFIIANVRKKTIAGAA